MKLRSALFLFLCFFAASLFAQDLRVLPEYKSRIIDETGTLNAETLSRIEARLEKLENEKGSQIAVLIIDSTKPEAIEQYSIRLAEKWKTGRKNIDDGVILLVALNDRRLRIEVGRGLEGAIPDAYAKRIIEEIIKPEFKAKNIPNGIEKGVEAIEKLIRGEKLPEPAPKKEENPDDGFEGLPWYGVLGLIVFFLIFIIIGIAAAFSSGKGAGFFVSFVSVGTFILVLISSGILFLAFFATAFISFMLGIFITAFRSGGGSSGGWSSGGSSGGWSSGGSSGGFSGGGGGSFGGGGSSGSW